MRLGQTALEVDEDKEDIIMVKETGKLIIKDLEEKETVGKKRVKRGEDKKEGEEQDEASSEEE